MFKRHNRMHWNRTILHSSAVFGGFLLFYLAFFFIVWGEDRLLAFGDGMVYYLPAYAAPKTLWTDLIFGGYPIMADPQQMTWYLPAMLLSWIPDSWNLFVILAYVLAASFTYLYVYTLTASRLASVVAGLTYSLSGFMMGHLTMISLVHAASWIPLFLCALERLRQRLQRRWLLLGIFAFVCCFMGGHPQSSLYGIGLGVFYALFLGWHAPVGRWRYYRYVLAVLMLGVGICAVQLLPAVELSRLSLRSELTQEAFLAGSLWPEQALQYVFPFLFGSGIALPPYTLTYWGKEGNVADIATYVGIVPLLLAGIGGCAKSSRMIVQFWFWAGIVAFILIFGHYGFLAQVSYYVPLYHAFRIPARHSLELAIAVSVLAGFGVAAIEQRAISARLLRRIVGVSLVVMGLALVAIGLWTVKFQATALPLGITKLTFWPWENAAVGVPIVIFSLGLMAIMVGYHWPRSWGSQLALLAAVTLDLVSFGFWFYDWPTIMPETAKIAPSAVVQQYRQTLNQTHQRLLIENGAWSQATPDRQHPIVPNLSRLWQLPSIGGYSPLILTRLSALTDTGNDGMVFAAKQSLLDQHRGLDLMAVKYRLSATSPAPAAAPPPAKELAWSEQDLGLSIGATGTAARRQSVSIKLPSRFGQTSEIALVSALGESVEIQNNTAVVIVQVIDTAGHTESHKLLAGRDTAETVIDCPDVQPRMQHRRADIFQTVLVERPGVGACPAHRYKSVIKLDRSQTIQQIVLNWNTPSGVIFVHRLTLFDRPHRTSQPIESHQFGAKWREVEHFPGGVMYENQQVLPRTWLVSKTMQLSPEQILAAIRTSQLPNGQLYEPEKVALVESPQAQFFNELNQPSGQVEMLKMTDTRVRLRTQTAFPQFLVLSDVFYPGWQATIDGQPAEIFPTNYVQRGVRVPAGNHVIEYRFEPLSFKLGAGLTIAACVGVVYWLGQKPR
jgi:hypothetical protein